MFVQPMHLLEACMILQVFNAAGSAAVAAPATTALHCHASPLLHPDMIHSQLTNLLRAPAAALQIACGLTVAQQLQPPMQGHDNMQPGKLYTDAKSA